MPARPRSVVGAPRARAPGCSTGRRARSCRPRRPGGARGRRGRRAAARGALVVESTARGVQRMRRPEPCEPQAEVDVLVVRREVLVEPADLGEDAAADEHARAGHRRDLPRARERARVAVVVAREAAHDVVGRAPRSRARRRRAAPFRSGTGAAARPRRRRRARRGSPAPRATRASHLGVVVEEDDELAVRALRRRGC